MKNKKTNHHSISLLPSGRTISFIISFFILLLIVPISPFFLANILPHQNIDVQINKYYSTSEAENVLKYVEELDLDFITGYRYQYGSGPLFMEGSRLDYYLDIIEWAKQTLTGWRINIEFVWNITVEPTYEELLNFTLFESYWNIMKTIEEFEVDESYLTWWDDNEQNEELNWNFTSSPFRNFSYAISWVIYGSFKWEYSQGSGGREAADQLIFLDSNLDIICLAYRGYYESYDL